MQCVCLSYYSYLHQHQADKTFQCTAWLHDEYSVMCDQVNDQDTCSLFSTFFFSKNEQNEILDLDSTHIELPHLVCVVLREVDLFVNIFLCPFFRLSSVLAAYVYFNLMFFQFSVSVSMEHSICTCFGSIVWCVVVWCCAIDEEVRLIKYKSLSFILLCSLLICMVHRVLLQT